MADSPWARYCGRQYALRGQERWDAAGQARETDRRDAQVCTG
jgi:hypothetical protein